MTIYEVFCFFFQIWNNDLKFNFFCFKNFNVNNYLFRFFFFFSRNLFKNWPLFDFSRFRFFLFRNFFRQWFFRFFLFCNFFNRWFFFRFFRFFLFCNFFNRWFFFWFFLFRLWFCLLKILNENIKNFIIIIIFFSVNKF